MKTILYSLPMFWLAAATAVPQAPPPLATPPPDQVARVIARGPHERVWSRTVRELTPSGRVREVEHRFVELATGMHYEQSGEWVESKEVIEDFPGGAIARQGQYRVIFARNLATAGAIDVETPDGKRLAVTFWG
jgi:hypothetical protein